MEHTPVPLVMLSRGRRETDWLFLRLTWQRMRGARRTLGFLFGVVVWPIWAAYLAMKLVRGRGNALRETAGIPLLKQWLDQVKLAVIFGRPPHTYYMYGFFDKTRAMQARDYVTPQEFRGVIEAGGDPDAFTLLNEKLAFEIACTENGLPTPRTLARVENGRAVTLDQQRCVTLPPADLFIKLDSGLGGRGAELWTWQDGEYRSSSGRSLTGSALLEDLCSRPDGETRLVQRRIRTEAVLEHFGVTALPTVRIMTGRSRSGDISIIAAVFKVPRVNAIIDNLTSGAVGCPVDLETGKLGPGFAKNSSYPIPEHPDTEVRFDSFQLPHWSATRDLARQAHAVFGGLAFVGWDIAIGEKGPVIVEGNMFPAVESMQQVHGPLLQNSTFRALCFEHAGSS